MIVNELLANLGLSEAESKIYLAALELGQSLPIHLAAKARIKRPTLYLALPKLFKQGLLSETVVGKRRYLIAEDPQMFLDQKQAELVQIDQLVPELRLLLATSSSKPQINFYQGVEGVKKVYMDTLKQKQPLLEFVGIDSVQPEIEHYIKNYYIAYRIKKGIAVKMLISGSPKSGIWDIKSGPHLLREVKTVPKELYPAPLDCFIYGNNVSFAVLRKDSEPVGLIIRSKEIATTMKSLFNFIWEKA